MNVKTDTLYSNLRDFPLKQERENVNTLVLAFNFSMTYISPRSHFFTPSKNKGGYKALCKNWKNILN